jgi:sugar phosphate isomerase/epimerase
MIGLGTYSFFWQHSDAAPEPLSLIGAFQETRDLGVGLFQICDFAPLEAMSDAALIDAVAAARDLGLTIQLGTKGLDQARLEWHLRLAESFGARIIRSMVTVVDGAPDIGRARRLLQRVLPSYEAAGVTLVLETYEQIATADLVALVDSLASPALGICLDPANVVARLESPRACIELTADRVRNVHVKDFAFDRQPGWVGFTFSGAPMGRGLHDYPHLLRTVQPREREIDEIVEHWLPWQGDAQTTIKTERQWTRLALEYLRSTNG